MVALFPANMDSLVEIEGQVPHGAPWGVPATWSTKVMEQDVEATIQKESYVPQNLDF